MLTLALALTLPSFGQDCDTDALVAEIEEASPQRIGEILISLGTCDADIARDQAPTLMPQVLSGDVGNQALQTAITVGADEAAASWIDGLQSDERASVVSFLGEACNSSEPIQEFFMSRAKALGEDFWSQRWYRPLATCHVPAVQQLLWAELEKGIDSNRSRFFAVLETYARSAEGSAIPQLEGLATQLDDAEAQANIINAFADAAQVGSLDGMNIKTAGQAAQTIVEIAPQLQAKAVEQARITLTTLGDEQAADSLAGVRYKDLVQSSGQYLWGTVVVENATCKSGKAAQRVQVAQVMDPGQTWPDQLKEKVEVTVNVSWTLDLASRCKGEGETSVLVPESPFADVAAFKTWADEQIKAVKRDDVKKTVRLDKPPVQL